MLNAVSDVQARAAIGLTYFGGLSPSEARGALCDGNTLRSTQSVWRTHAGPTKTESREQPIPVIQPLRDILAELRAADGNPSSGPILRAVKRTKRDENGEQQPIPAKPLNLDNHARRVIRPALAKADVKWNGWYANRRGAGTIATAVPKDSGLAAKGLLRHANLSTTTQHYVKGVPAETQLAMKRVEQLFQGCSKEIPTNKESVRTNSVESNTSEMWPLSSAVRAADS